MGSKTYKSRKIIFLTEHFSYFQTGSTSGDTTDAPPTPKGTTAGGFTILSEKKLFLGQKVGHFFSFSIFNLFLPNKLIMHFYKLRILGECLLISSLPGKVLRMLSLVDSTCLQSQAW